MRCVWVLCVVCGVWPTTPALAAATLPHTAHKFLEEIREVLDNQWQIINNIKYHTVSTKLRLAKMVQELRGAIAAGETNDHVVVQESNSGTQSIGNILDTHIPESSHQGVTGGLGKTKSALKYNNYDWRVLTTASPTSVREATDSEEQNTQEPEVSHTTDGYMARVLAGLEALFHAEDPVTARPAKQDLLLTLATPPEVMMEVLAGLEALLDALDSHVDFSPNLPVTQDLPPTSAVPPQSMMGVMAGLAALSRTHDTVVEPSDLDNNPVLHKPAEDVQDIITALATLARQRGILVNTSVNDAGPEATTEYQSVSEVLEAMEELSKSVGARTAIEKKARNLPCEEPFVEIAYRMCILQETTHKLSWAAARDYCRKRGAELAQDAVVIKARRYFNTLYGESGSRVRWPIWVGGRETKEGGARVWRWEDGSAVPTFIWSDDQPRSFTLQQAPDGTCMFLDGYKSFYAASLPCHLKRRFVCQRRD